MGKLFSAPRQETREIDPEVARKKAEVEKKASDERAAEQSRKDEEQSQSQAGNRGTRQLFSGGVTGFDTLSPRGFFRTK